MDLPDTVADRLDGEPVVGGVDLGGDDAVVVTPTRTLVYRAEGLLSDESISEFPHDAERIDLSEGRRKTTFRFSYVDGTRDFSVGSKHVEGLLAPLLWGVLNGAGVIEDDETVEEAYRFSELTLVVTSDRIAEHVGSALWDEEFEQFPYADLTDLDFEEGSVATAIVVEVGGRAERIKTPNDRAGVVRRAVEEAVFDYHGVDSLEALRAAVAPEDDGDDDDPLSKGGFEPLVDEGRGGTGGGGGGADPEAGTGGAPAGDTATTAGAGGDVAAELAALRETVERQNELLERQQATIEQLVDELRRGR